MHSQARLQEAGAQGTLHSPGVCVFPGCAHPPNGHLHAHPELTAALPFAAAQDNYALTFGNSTRKAYQKETERRKQPL